MRNTDKNAIPHKYLAPRASAAETQKHKTTISFTPNKQELELTPKNLL